MALGTPIVAIVLRTGECDVAEIPDVPRMSYDDGVGFLRKISVRNPAMLAGFDLVYVTDDGELGRFASWSLDNPAACERCGQPGTRQNPVFTYFREARIFHTPCFGAYADEVLS